MEPTPPHNDKPLLPAAANSNPKKADVSDFVNTSQDRGGKLGKIYGLLMEGHTLQTIQKLTGLPYKKIRLQALKYEGAGLIERTNQYPLIFQKAREIYPPYMTGNDLPPSPRVMPVKIGASFLQIGKRPNVQFNAFGKHHIDMGLYHYTLGRHKTVIWLKSFIGSNVEEIRQNAKLQFKEYAGAISAKHNLNLVLNKIYDGVEWVWVNKELSKQTAQTLAMYKGEQRPVAGAIHKWADKSHPRNFQINPAPGGDPLKTDAHAKITEYLYPQNEPAALETEKYIYPPEPEAAKAAHESIYKGQLQRDLEALTAAAKETAAAMKAISDAVIVINQRLIMLEEKKGGRP